MIRSLQIKLVLSLALLVLMLLAAAVMSMMEFRNMGDSVKGVLNNNFSSIEAAKRMMESLEREDSGLLLWIIGERDEGSQTILTSHAIISIVAAILFALLLYYFIRIYFFRPVKHLTESIRDYYPEKGRLDACIATRDEFNQLEEEMNNLISRLLWRREQPKD